MCSMPLLYLIGFAWLAVIELVDRHALTRLCRRPVRYGPRLPYLLLGAWMGEARGKGGCISRLTFCLLPLTAAPTS